MKKLLLEIKGIEPRRAHGNISDLRDSIKSLGLINPLTIDQEGNLLAGRRRFQAINELGWEEVDVTVLPVDGDQLKAFRVAIDENLKRKNLTDPEVAVVIKEYDELKRKLEGEAKGGTRTDLGHSITEVDGWSLQKTAADLGISKPAVVKAIKIATAVEEHPDLARLKGEQILRILKIEAQREQIQKLKTPTGLYDVVVIDPPWQIAGDYDPDGRRAANPYPTMSFEEIKDIKLPATENCVLWLWVTNQNIHEGFHLLEIWGFEFKNILTWVKQSFGIGVWLRNQTEHCLLATSGKPILDGSATPTVLFADRTSHSAKPDAFYELVDKICVGQKLDYFSRKQREGWACYGNEV